MNILAMSVFARYLAQAGSEPGALLDRLGVPVGFLVLTVFALKAMAAWMRESQARERELAAATLAYERAEHAETLKRTAEIHAEALKREREARDRLEAALYALHESVREKIVPVLERATLVMADELKRRDEVL